MWKHPRNGQVAWFPTSLLPPPPPFTFLPLILWESVDHGVFPGLLVVYVNPMEMSLPLGEWSHLFAWSCGWSDRRFPSWLQKSGWWDCDLNNNYDNKNLSVLMLASPLLDSFCCSRGALDSWLRAESHQITLHSLGNYGEPRSLEDLCIILAGTDFSDTCYLDLGQKYVTTSGIHLLFHTSYFGLSQHLAVQL